MGEVSAYTEERTPLLINRVHRGTINEQDYTEPTHLQISGNGNDSLQQNNITENTGECCQTEPEQLPVAIGQTSSQHRNECDVMDKGYLQKDNGRQQSAENGVETEEALRPVVKARKGKTCTGGTFSQRVYICLAVSFYFFAIMMDDEAWPQLVRSRVVRDTGANLSHTQVAGCTVNYTISNNTTVKVQQLSTTINTYFLMAAYIPAIFSNVIIGKLTDKFGRKIGLYSAIVGAIVKYSIIAVCIHFNLNIDISYVGFVLYGLSGTYSIISQTSNAFAADITEAGTDRAFFFAIVSFFKGLATLLGQFAAGYIIQYVGQFYIYIIAIGAMMCAFFTVAFCLSESGFRQQRNGDLAIQQCERTGQTSVSEMDSKPPDRSNRSLQGVLLAAYILTCLRDMGLSTVTSLFMLDSPFCWTSVQIGWLLSLITVCKLVGTLLVGLFQKCTSDVIIAIIGTITTAASHSLFTFAYNDVMVYSGMFLKKLYLMHQKVCVS
ncbi:Solute carrier family 46 member 3 [Mizuhopecten yessoensis]|uniref:Solute carrier family 46 member 3 n=1 Tax=Mizuhopecten yessoensis TaxID=6573 RepID=A0A210PPH4_MIZYE|nr:Solute carrier family 46 member 3 [Mizuhopecten yessoensis]